MKLTNQGLLKNKAFINGTWIGSKNSYDILNPATLEVLATVPDLRQEETDQAINAAESAFKTWSKEKAKTRTAILKKWFDLINENADDLAKIITAECGKPIAEAKGEVSYGASFVEWFAEEAKRVYGDTIPSTIDNARIMTIRQPVGVCAAITPWNFPLAMITRKVAPALAAGCTVICKPAEDTPLSALALAALAEEAGLPKGVLNIVTTNNPKVVGLTLCDSPVVRKLSFTGGTDIGKILMEQCADTLKKLSMELGGNAPFIVFKDADIDEAVKGAVACKFRNAGQTCVCANRFYIHEDIYDEFVEKFVAQVKDLRIGNGAEQGTEIGPLINQQAIDKIEKIVADAVEHGGEILVGGKKDDAGELFYKPTIITKLNCQGSIACDALICNNEIFGPVAPIYKFKDEDDVIKRANDTEYGLASYFYARDIGQIWRVAEALESGIVAVNAPTFSTEVAPFGGIKESGFGREGSKYGIDEYTELKYILMAGLGQ